MRKLNVRLGDDEMVCRICSNQQSNKIYMVKENMYHMDEEFEYFQCGHCGCLQISQAPSDIWKYYKQNYYSFNSSSGKNPLKIVLDKLRTTYALFGTGSIGGFLFNRFPKRNLKSLSFVPLDINSHVVDVGCGAGELLSLMKQAGMKNLVGIDPFIPESINYGGGLVIEKKTFFELNKKQDLVMFHHSFEHMENQLETLKKAQEILNPGATILIRIPTVSSYAWRRYGVNWVQIDAPRHFYLHSIQSIKLLAEKANLELFHYYYDSWSFQFWGSEQYEKGISLHDKFSQAENAKSNLLTEDMNKYNHLSNRLNSVNQGDAVSLYFRSC